MESVIPIRFQQPQSHVDTIARIANAHRVIRQENNTAAATEVRSEREMIDFKKLMNQTPEEKAQAEEAIERMRNEFLNSVKDDPEVIRIKKLMGEHPSTKGGDR